jgi:bifunctional DNA-binding transcriptional regulator/antitoxin component of YhaV-PrlF toxin-antitoxin module
MLESTISKDGKTTLPRAVREILALQPGDRVRYLLLEGGVMILKLGSIDRLYGMLKYDGPPVSLEEMERAIVACED